jgi:mannan endo-1,4-beta-mannosidase
MSFLFNKLPFASPVSAMTSAVLGVSLAAVGTAIYLSPGGNGHPRSKPHAATSTPSATQPETTPTPSSSRTSTPKPTRSGGSGKTSVDTPALPYTGALAADGATTTMTKSVRRGLKRQYCTDFSWQQDAQAAYLANLSDPWGLDGAPGAHNGDGLACSQLPVDPNRPAPRPVDAYVPPAPGDKPALLSPSRRYYGIAEDGLPGDTPLYDSVATSAGKAPSSLEWFSYWDTGYDAAKVQASWARGALPVITWMSVPSDSAATDASQYTLANIVSGQFDSYLLKYAGAVLKTGLPVAIRFDHEMNGNWYPWSAGLPANQTSSGTNMYVQAWRHVWNVFDSVGANADVIWMWSPVRVNNITPHSATMGYKYETTLHEDYPGDQYVDWLGMSAYQYKPADGWSYETTFRETLNGLHTIAAKPIFIAETSATEAANGTDYAAEKAQWTKQTLAGLAAEPDVVGFVWFNNNVDDVHTVDGKPIQTDWQFSSSPAALAAFKAGIRSAQYASGTMPDATGG